MITLCSLPHLSARWLRLVCRESNPEVLYSRRVEAEQWMIFRGIFDLFSCTKNETNWINSIHQCCVLSLELRHSEPKKDAKSYSFLRCDVYIGWESDLPWYSMLCYCVRKSKHRVNRDNTLLYSARFNLVKPSHADSKNVTQMEQKLSTTYSMLVF